MRRVLVASLLAVALAGCATPTLWSFTYGNPFRASDVEVIAYQLGGDATQGLTRDGTFDWAGARIEQFHNVSLWAPPPPGDFLRVKWRVPSTGAVYDTTADLRGKLPAHFDKILYFVPVGEQLHVYIVEPSADVRPIRECPAVRYRAHKCAQIHPSHEANY